MMKEKLLKLTKTLLDTDDGITEEAKNNLAEVWEAAGMLEFWRNEIAGLIQATDGAFYVHEGALDRLIPL